MYLMILEDGSKWKASALSDEDLLAVDDGVLEVIDLSDPDGPKELYEGDWHSIASRD